LGTIEKNKPGSLSSNGKIHEFKLMHNGLVHGRLPANNGSQVRDDSSSPVHWFCVGALALLVVSLCGCNRDEISSYRVPKEKAGESIAGEAGSASAPAEVHWVTPPGWVELPATNMRAAGFKISTNGETAEVSIVPMPGVTGIERESVNMWRQTLGLSPLDGAGFSKAGESVLVGKNPARLFDMAGADGNNTNKNRIVGAIADTEGSLWFFKMHGDNHLVSQEKPVFQDFLKSITFTRAPEANISAPPFARRPMGPIDRVAPERPIEASAHPSWKTPDGWSEQQPASRMLLASYSVHGKTGGKAEVTVSMLSGEGGGLLANVNRWRGQLGLSPITENEIPQMTSKIDLGAIKMTEVNLTAQDGSRAMHALIVPRDENTWFYKMTGDPAALADQKKSFMEFAAIAH
jgi:hypothetical protein